jgi:hypothetical protein
VVKTTHHTKEKVMAKKSPTMVAAGHKAAKVRVLNEKIRHATMVLAGLKAAKSRIQNS